MPWLKLFRREVLAVDGPQDEGASPANRGDEAAIDEKTPVKQADAEQWLRAFIDDFLTPIAADGRLDQKEETPLLAAYCACGIHELQSDSDGRIDEELRDAIRNAAARGENAGPRRDLSGAWRRIIGRANRITRGDFEKLRTWFHEEAAKLRSEDAFSETPADAEFLQTALDARIVSEFHRLFDDACPQPPESAAQADLRAPSPGPVEGLVTVSFDQASCDELIRRVEVARFPRDADAIAAHFEKLLEQGGLLGQAFDEYRRDDPRLQAVVAPSAGLLDDANLWFVGDLHGDLLALEAALLHIDSHPSPQPARIVFLGDLFDDGADGFGVLLRVLDLVRQRPRSIVVLAGNHDEALGRIDSSFCSSVSPSDFADWLNMHREDAITDRIGKLAIRFFECAPRALFLPDGLMAAHGGIPHSDQWDSLTTPEAFNSRQCLSDFVWTRAHERARTRRPNRASRGCEFGYEDFFEFCKRAAEAIGRPVERMVRGHDHVAERFARYERYDDRLLTINAMSHRLPRELFADYPCTPCVARWAPGTLPEVHRLAIPPDTIRRLYPEALEPT